MADSSASRHTRRRQAFTVIELIVVIAVMGILASLLLPAVQSSREKARQTQCRNNLRQVGIAVHNHESQFGHFPSCGWSLGWIGEPAMGIGPPQPGGWIYNLLPFVDRSDLMTLGLSSDPGIRLAEQQHLLRTSIPLFRCPSRGAPILSPPGNDYRRSLINSVYPPEVAKADYAVNAGDWGLGDLQYVPGSLDQIPGFQFRDATENTGVSFQRSRIRTAQITDGLTTTILAGEKYVSVESYGGMSEGYDASMYNGASWDQYRWTHHPLAFDGFEEARVEGLAGPGEVSFGGPHRNGVFFVMCDGSVRLISHFMDETTYRRLGNRHDGYPVSLD